VAQQGRRQGGRQGQDRPATTNANGGWKAEPSEAITEGAAGTIYKCLGASSKVRTISGG
jgi:hypothetical protein